MIKKRDYLWDNIKAILIFLVVLGHVLELCDRQIYPSIFMDKFIYMFHMPAFIFVSGFLAKSYCTNGKVRSIKVINLMAYYLIFQIIFFAIRIVIDHQTNFSILEPNRGLWYLLALIMYYLMIPVIEKLSPILVIGLSIIFSLLVGVETKNIDNFMGIQRAIVFSPFFCIGYYLTSEKIEKLRSINIIVRIVVSIVITAVSSVTLYLMNDQLKLSLFYGKSNYQELKYTVLQGFSLRALVILMASSLIFVLILILPSKKTFFSFIGKNSLQIFILHMAIIITLITMKIKPTINGPLDIIAVIFVSLMSTVLLSFKVFEYPFDLIRKAVARISNRYE